MGSKILHIKGMFVRTVSIGSSGNSEICTNFLKHTHRVETLAGRRCREPASAELVSVSNNAKFYPYCSLVATQYTIERSFNSIRYTS